MNFRILYNKLPKAMEFLKQVLIFQSFNNKASIYAFTSSFKQQVGHITPQARDVRHFSDTNNIEGLSKNMAGNVSSQNFNLNYSDILKAQKDDSILIIDVREDSEIQETGKLPGSIHIPNGEVVTVLSTLSKEDFEKKYHKHKPTKETKIIFSCKSGRRSLMAHDAVQKLGFTNVYNYAGGWLDWERHQTT